MVLIDTDVLLIKFRYLRDIRFEVNSLFLSRAREDRACITVYNLMEFLGQMSFGLSPTQLSDWDRWLRDEYVMTVIWPEARGRQAEDFFHQEVFEGPLSKMVGSGGMAFHDALIITLGERIPDIEAFVTWNARHFRGKTTLSVLTPQEYVQAL
ncbi:hypothetical protein HYY27_05965 [bacterium]|nr:hypothetical protein [bacterium]